VTGPAARTACQFDDVQPGELAETDRRGGLPGSATTQDHHRLHPTMMSRRCMRTNALDIAAGRVAVLSADALVPLPDCRPQSQSQSPLQSRSCPCRVDGVSDAAPDVARGLHVSKWCLMGGHPPGRRCRVERVQPARHRWLRQYGGCGHVRCERAGLRSGSGRSQLRRWLSAGVAGPGPPAARRGSGLLAGAGGPELVATTAGGLGPRPPRWSYVVRAVRRSSGRAWRTGPSWSRRRSPWPPTGPARPARAPAG
jgi:hypothetical protein